MSRPKCPNHTCEMDRTDNPRKWICPISGWEFEAEIDEQIMKTQVDVYGRPLIKYIVKGDDSKAQ